MDGPWQIGHKTAERYARLAAETARAMRRVDPSIELVVCGSSHQRMPTFGDWEATVLRETYDLVDHVSPHSYYEQRGDDQGSFLASRVNMDRFIESVIATRHHVCGVGQHKKRLTLAVDEWNVWYQSKFPGESQLDWAERPRLIEDQYSVVDAVVVGSLLISLLRHADRVKIACLAQLAAGGPAGRREGHRWNGHGRAAGPVLEHAELLARTVRVRGTGRSTGSVVPAAPPTLPSACQLPVPAVPGHRGGGKGLVPQVRAGLSRKQLQEIGARMIEPRKDAPRRPSQPSALKKAADAVLS